LASPIFDMPQILTWAAANKIISDEFCSEEELSAMRSWEAAFLTSQGFIMLVVSASGRKVGHIAHEVVHFARKVLECENGVDLTKETEEVYGYFIQHFTQRIYDAFKKDGLIK
jgi:hypothetical protein